MNRFHTTFANRVLAIPISQKIWVHENIIAIFEILLAPFLVIKDPSTICTRKKREKKLLVPRASLGRICIPFLVKDNYFPKSQGTQWVQLHLGKERKLPHITNVYQITYFK